MVEELIEKTPIDSLRQQYDRFSNDKIKSKVKDSVKNFIGSFFENAHRNHNLLKIISPGSITYVTDKSFDLDSDPTLRKLTIGKYSSEIRANVPCILVVDGGIESQNAVGLLGEVSNYRDQSQNYFPIVKTVELTIISAARDWAEADEMISVQSLLFNELRNIAGGSYISGDSARGETWVMSFQNEPVNMGTTSNFEVPGSPQEKVYYNEYTVRVKYEDFVKIQFHQATFHFAGTSLAGLQPQLNPPYIFALGQRHPIQVSNIRDEHRVLCNDPNIATVSTDGWLIPRKLGKTKLFIAGTKPLVSHEIEIV